MTLNFKLFVRFIQNYVDACFRPFQTFWEQRPTIKILIIDYFRMEAEQAFLVLLRARGRNILNKYEHKSVAEVLNKSCFKDIRHAYFFLIIFFGIIIVFDLWILFVIFTSSVYLLGFRLAQIRVDPKPHQYKNTQTAHSSRERLRDAFTAQLDVDASSKSCRAFSFNAVSLSIQQATPQSSIFRARLSQMARQLLGVPAHNELMTCGSKVVWPLPPLRRRNCTFLFLCLFFLSLTHRKMKCGVNKTFLPSFYAQTASANLR